MRFALVLLFICSSYHAHADLRVCTGADSTTRYHCTLLKDGSLITAGMACGLAARAFDDFHPLPASDIGRLSPESVNRFDRSATRYYSPSTDDLSGILAGVTLAAPLALFANDGIRASWRSFSFMYFEVLLFSYTLPAIAKSIVERERPYVYNPAVPLEKKQTRDAQASFFSRHTTAAFASSVFLSTLYESYNPESVFKPWLWTVSLAGATTVGYMRYRSGDHYPTDILTGAAVGSLIGWGIPRLHRSLCRKTHIGIDPFRQTLYVYREL